MTPLARRDWVPAKSEDLVQALATATASSTTKDIATRLEQLAQDNRTIHERDCFNLNPATNAMNPRAEALLAADVILASNHSTLR